MCVTSQPPIVCIRCGAPADGNPIARGAVSISANNVVTNLDTHWRMNKAGGCYCPECAPSVVFCRICGCSDEAGCPERCMWVARDLCSVCASAQPLEMRECICGVEWPASILHCLLCGHSENSATCFCAACKADPSPLSLLWEGMSR